MLCCLAAAGECAAAASSSLGARHPPEHDKWVRKQCWRAAVAARMPGGVAIAANPQAGLGGRGWRRSRARAWCCTGLSHATDKP